MKIIIVLLINLLLIGCASGPPTSIEETYNKTELKVDEYSKVRLIQAPLVTISYGIDGGGGMYLQKVNDSYQLRVNTFSQLGWCFFESAIDKNSGSLTFNKIRSNVGGGGTTFEDFYLDITKEQLQMMVNNGLDVRVYGRNRTINISLPSIYVKGFIKKVNSLT